MSHPTEDALDDALISVKNELVTVVRTGDYDSLKMVLSTLRTMRPVFSVCVYHYKMVELCEAAIFNLNNKKAELPTQAKRRREEYTTLIACFNAMKLMYRSDENKWKLAA